MKIPDGIVFCSVVPQSQRENTSLSEPEFINKRLRMPTFSIPHFHLWESEVRHNPLWNRGLRNSCTAAVTRLFWSLPQTCQLASLWNQPWVSSCDSKDSRLAVNLVSFFGLEKQSTIPILFKWLIIYKLGRRNLLSLFPHLGGIGTPGWEMRRKLTNFLVWSLSADVGFPR